MSSLLVPSYLQESATQGYFDDRDKGDSEVEQWVPSLLQHYSPGEHHYIDYVFWLSLEEQLTYMFTRSDVTSLYIDDIDRGIPSEEYVNFADLLSLIFPNLRYLRWAQNYSFSLFDPISAQEGLEAFLRHEWVRKLPVVMIQDTQSDWNISQELLQEVTPEGGVRCIRYNYNREEPAGSSSFAMCVK